MTLSTPTPLTDEEIATFQKECAGSNSEWGDWPNIDMQRALATITSLQSDLQRTRDALQKIAASGPVSANGKRDADAGWSFCYDTANAALTPPTGT
jgi:hypothetical protein